MLALGLGLGLPFAAAAAGGAAPYVPPTGPSIIERFNQTSTNIDGLAITPYGGATITRRSTAGITNQPTIASGNLLPGANANANNQKTAAVIGLNAVANASPTITTRRRYSWRFGLNGLVNIANQSATFVVDFITNLFEVTATSSYSRVRLRYLGSVNGGTFVGNVGYSTSGQINADTAALTFTGDGAAFDLTGGDELMMEEYQTGGQMFIDVYKNGLKMLAGTTDLIALGIKINQNAGVTANGDSTLFKLDEFRNVDPALQSDLRIALDSHIAQRAFWTGSPTDANVNLPILYDGPTAPASLTYTVYDTTSGARVAVVGQTDLSLTTTTPAGGSCSANIKVPSPTASFQIGVKWNVNINGESTAFVEAFTPVMSPGEIIGFDGQSRVQKFYQSLTSYAFTDAPSAWFVDASDDSSVSSFPDYSTAGNLNRRTRRSNTTTVRPSHQTGLGAMAVEAAALFGHSNFTLLCGGHGAQDQTVRNIGSNCWLAFLEGLKRTADLGVFYITDHAYEVDNSGGNYPTNWDSTAAATWLGIICSKVAAVEAYVGHPILVVLTPSIIRIGLFTSTAGVRGTAFNRTVALTIANNGDGRFASSPYGSSQRFFLGAQLDDPTLIDTYHETSDVKGFGIQAHRQAHDWAKVRGIASTGRLGAVLVSGAITSSTNIRLTFSAPAHAVSAALRGLTATDPNAGMHFFSDTGLTTEINATVVAAPSAISSGQFTVDFTFASLPATVYVTSVLGCDPLNPDQNGTLVTDRPTTAPCIVLDYGDTGVGTTHFNPPQQRFYDLAGPRDAITVT